MRRVTLGKMIFDQEKIDAVVRVLRYGGTTEMKETRLFEQRFAECYNAPYCVATSSGTAALFTIFQALIDGTPRKVLTSPLTYTATVNAPYILGYEIDFVDVDRHTFSMDIDKANEILEQDEFGVLLPVHLLGYPVHLDRLKARSNLTVVEDACEAVGTKKIGLGYASAFSFYPSHTIPVGEMGAIVTRDGEFAKKCAMLKDNGRDRQNFGHEFVHYYVGVNSKSSDVVAAVANIQLAHMEDIVRQRQLNAKQYCDELSSLAGVEPGKFDVDCSYLGFPIMCDTPTVVAKVSEGLRTRGVEFRRMFPLIYNQPAFRKMRGYRRCPTAEQISLRGLYLPCHQYLSSEDVHYVSESVRRALP